MTAAITRAAPLFASGFTSLAIVSISLWVVAAAQLLAQVDGIRSANFDATTNQLAELGKSLFFDGRLSGDATTSCATCHDPHHAFTDGLELSRGYPGTLYFRNAPTLINAADQSSFYWDGRLSGDDLPSLIRDHISEAHFMQADGRLVIERLRQVPAYVTAFQQAFDGDVTYGRILQSIAVFVRTLASQNVPYDRFLAGDKTAMSEAGLRGWELFHGKADCFLCHSGRRLSDGDLHATGVPTNSKIFSDPERHITFRRFMRTMGVGDCATLRTDIGYACVTKSDADRGKFRTPSLREVSRTAPYMHNGVYATLAEVVEHYNRGGGESAEKDERLKPLRLTEQEQADLVAFLEHLSGDQTTIEPMEPVAYALRPLGKAGELPGSESR